MTAILSVSDLSHSFGAVSAISSFSLSISEGELLGLIGPNGCGKTTLFDCVSGRYRPSSGSVALRGMDITGVPMSRVSRLGLVRTFQESRVFGSDTVKGNVERALDLARIKRSASAKASTLPSDADGLLEFCGITALAALPVSILSFGSLRQLGIAIAMAAKPIIVLLDEPAAGLNDPESAMLAATLRRLHQCGVAMVVVDHDMDFVVPLVERLVVMVDGRHFREGAPAALMHDTAVIAAYLGSGKRRGAAAGAARWDGQEPQEEEGSK